MPLGATRLNFLAKTSAAPSITYPEGVEFERASTERIRVTSTSNLPADNKVMTASMWFKPSSIPVSGQHTMLSAINTGLNEHKFIYELASNSGGVSRIRWGAPGLSFIYTSLPSALSTGQWYHLVCKMNGTNSGRTQLWLDGTRVYDAAASNFGSNILYSTTASYGLGCRDFTTSVDNWNGCLAQIYWYAGDIDLDADISKFYNNGVVDFGASGTSSGLPTPHIYHKGNSQSLFDDILGSITGTASVTGTLASCT
ncbi:hypothetical protein [Phage DSL-LC06]|nr:hypothetical protein [Phage DSL-LC06]